LRLYIKFSFEQLELPTEYNNILQGFVYNIISEEKYRKFLHDKGYQLGKRTYKLFSFSRLLGKFELNKENKTIKFLNEAKLIISSYDTLLAEFIIEKVGTFDSLRIGRNIVRPEKIEIFEFPQTQKIVVSTKSPITVYSTIEKDDGKKFTKFHSPNEDDFIRILKENLLRKYQTIHETPFKGELHIENIAEKPKKVILQYKNRKLDGWITVLKLEGDYEILKIAYDTGLGSKNSAGFGCIELVDKVLT